jgi:glutathione S-transferase
VKLYTFDAAPNPRRVNLFIRYKGIELPTQQVNLRESEQLSAAFKAINPRCIVPALQLDDGSVLCDGVAICSYLESLHPDKPLMGSTALSKAQVFSWDHQIFNDALMPVAEALRNRSKAFKDRALPGPQPIAQIPELEARGRHRLRQFWTYLDGHLQGQEFIVGDALTLADIDAFVIIDFAGWIKESVPQDCTNVQTWAERVRNCLNLPAAGAQT